MNNSKYLAGLRYTIHSGILIVCSFVFTATFAETSPSADSNADTAIETVEAVEEDTVVMQGEASQKNLLISTTFSPSDMGFGQNKVLVDPSQDSSRHTDSDLTAVTARNESRLMPYSLVLALIAFIVLAPVSRRIH